jgi:AcrR family transcriptional regulator
MSAAGVRARVRAELTEEIKTVARRHLASEGANLSLRAVARDLGMASSAVYRYFASRDELLTALIIDAYDAVGAAAERAIEGVPGHTDRLISVGLAVRDWAMAEPHQWALIYGSPVPGYQAPQDTIGPAPRVIMLIVSIVRDAVLDGAVTPGPPITGRYAEELAVVAAQFDERIPPQVAGATIAAFVQLCGAVSSELFGQLDNSIDEDRRGFFEFQMRGAARLIGLPVGS